MRNIFGDIFPINKDPLENLPGFSLVIKEAEDEAIRRLRKKGHTIPSKGCCHLIWQEKKKILKEEAGIEWRTPAELNPNMKFD